MTRVERSCGPSLLSSQPHVYHIDYVVFFFAMRIYVSYFTFQMSIVQWFHQSSALPLKTASRLWEVCVVTLRLC